jgi:hypothetical protein
LVDAVCPVCGKHYAIPSGRGRELVVTKFLNHKDACQLPSEDEFVKVGGRVGIVIESRPKVEAYPVFEVQMPSGRTNNFRAAEITRMDDQDEGRRQFYE